MRYCERNRRLLLYVADDLLFLNEALGQGARAEAWGNDWTRFYISYSLQRLGSRGADLRTAFWWMTPIVWPWAALPYKLRSRGSNTSRSQSPSRLTAVTVSVMASPGKTDSHHAISR
jgi:hypothetical protein